MPAANRCGLSAFSFRRRRFRLTGFMGWWLLVLATSLTGLRAGAGEDSSYAAAWEQATAGTNLALGREVTYGRKPDRLPNRGNEAAKLTDGIILGGGDDQIWKNFGRRVSSWVTAQLGVSLLVDLGAVHDIEKVVARFSGGKPEVGVAFPSEIVILASEDGTNFFQVAKRTKVTEGERELARTHPDQFYFRPEGYHETVMETFPYGVNCRARYIGISVKSPRPLLAIDEVAVIEGKPGNTRALESFPPAVYANGKVEVQPRTKELVITTNVVTGNWFYVIGADSAEAETRVQFDLPSGVILRTGDELRVREEPSANGETVRRIVEGKVYNHGGNNLLGPLFFSLEDGVRLGADAVATVVYAGDQTKGLPVVVPIKTVEVPAVPKLKVLQVSLAWTRSYWADDHPEFLNLYSHCGFTIYPLLTWFRGPPTHPEYSQHLGEDTAKAAALRELGFQVLLVESPIHRLTSFYGKYPEIRHIVKGKPGRQICPTYRGTHYQTETARLAEQSRAIHPNFIFYNIEKFRPSALEEAKTCSRCREAFRQSGLKSWSAFLYSQGTQMMRDFQRATAGTTPEGGDPSSGLYDVTAMPSKYDIFDFEEIFPKYIQFGQPHMYFGGDVERIHHRLRENYEVLQKRALVPWLTGGTFGEYPSHKLEAIILECFLNGASGITYYRYDDMDPMDYFYHAVALKTLAPFEELLKEGKGIEMASSNERLTCSAFGTDGEALVLVGNYAETPQTQTGISFPGRTVRAVREVKGDREMAGKELDHLQVDPKEHRLLLVTFDSLGE